MKRFPELILSVLILLLPVCGLSEEAPDTTIDQTVQQTDAEFSLPETVIMGSFPQSGAEPEPIRWKVLGEENGGVLLLAEYGLEALPFNEERKTVSWEESSLRAWLNGNFYDSAFSETERNRILDRGDRVFLLSAEEVKKYLPNDSDRLCMPTAYAVSHGAYANDEGNSAWWLRSAAEKPAQAAYLSSAGSFGSRTHYVDETVIAVRPAIWVEKSSLQ